MSQTHTNLLYHLVFGTKSRKRWIDDTIRSAVHEYIGGIVRNLDGKALQIGGTDDHVHILAYLPATIAISDALRTIKANSSKWIHGQGNDYADFAWQSGYGAFTVSQSNRDDVFAYIANQAEHHKRFSFEDEYRRLLEKHGIEFDERYMWD